MVPPVLAVNVNEVIGIVVLVISVLSWVVNVIQGNSPDGTPKKPKPKPKPQTGRSEIETLLQELTADKRKPKPEQRQAETQPVRQPPPERVRPKAKTVPQRPGGPPPYTPSRQPAQAAQPKRSTPNVRAADPSNLGSGVRSLQLSNRVDNAVQQDIQLAVQKDIQVAVQHDLGNRIAPASETREQPVHPLVKIMRDPNGIRQAIMLNEIMQRPKSLRR